MRGSRVQAVVAELQGEKIDIIPWSQDPATFVVNALAPAEVAKVVLDEETRKIEVVVPDEQLSLAIGRRGQNVRLASTLSGWEIDILTEEQESERRQAEVQMRSQTFIDALDVDDVIAHFLVSEGFTSIEEVAFVPEEELLAIEGFDNEVAQELRLRARNFLAKENERLEARVVELEIEETLRDLPGMTTQMAVALGEAEIKTLEDFADLASDELTGSEDGLLSAFKLSEAEANEFILRARVVAGWITEEDLAVALAPPEGAVVEAAEAETEPQPPADA